MRHRNEFKVELKAIQQQFFGAKNNEFAYLQRELKFLCRKFSFTTGLIKSEITLGLKER